MLPQNLDAYLDCDSPPFENWFFDYLANNSGELNNEYFDTAREHLAAQGITVLGDFEFLVFETAEACLVFTLQWFNKNADRSMYLKMGSFIRRTYKGRLF